MQQWEYCRSESEDQNLTMWGLEGWELCGKIKNDYIFKRPIGPNWKERCEAAEAVINATNEADEIIAADIWEQIKNKHNAQEKRTTP